MTERDKEAYSAIQDAVEAAIEKAAVECGGDLVSLHSEITAALINILAYHCIAMGGATTPPGSKETAIDPAHRQVCLGTVDEYDPATDTWRERSPMPTPRNHAAIGVVNGKIYVIGGRVGAAFISLASDTSVVEV